MFYKHIFLSTASVVIGTFLYFLLGGVALASSQSNSNDCSGNFGTINFGFTCSGAQNFPDDGQGNVPVSFNKRSVDDVAFLSPNGIFSAYCFPAICQELNIQYGVDTVNLEYDSSIFYTDLAEYLNLNQLPYTSVRVHYLDTFGVDYYKIYSYSVPFDFKPLFTSFIRSNGQACVSSSLNLHYFFIDNDFSNPLELSGSGLQCGTLDPLGSPYNIIVNDYAFTSSLIVPSSTGSSSPLYVQDAGNVSLALSIIIGILSIGVAGFMWNKLSSKKPWL